MQSQRDQALTVLTNLEPMMNALFEEVHKHLSDAVEPVRLVKAAAATLVAKVRQTTEAPLDAGLLNEIDRLASAFEDLQDQFPHTVVATLASQNTGILRLLLAGFGVSRGDDGQIVPSSRT